MRLPFWDGACACRLFSGIIVILQTLDPLVSETINRDVLIAPYNVALCLTVAAAFISVGLRLCMCYSYVQTTKVFLYLIGQLVAIRSTAYNTMVLRTTACLRQYMSDFMYFDLVAEQRFRMLLPPPS